MGALIVSRYPRHALGWLLCVSSLLCVTLAGEAYSVWVLDGDGPGPALGAHLVAWAAPLLGWPAFVALIMIFLTAPDGRLASPRWRWAVWVTLTGLVLRLLGALLTPPATFVSGAEYSGSTRPNGDPDRGVLVGGRRAHRLRRVLGGTPSTGPRRRTAAAPLDQPPQR